MNRFIVCLVLCAVGAAQQATAASVVRIVDGDCNSLSAAAAAQAGQEPALIVLARNGHYAACALKVTGNITLDGAGAQMLLIENRQDSNEGSQIAIAAGGQLTIRNVNFDNAAASGATASDKTPQPKFLISILPAVSNNGTLELESVSFANESFGGHLSEAGGGFIANSGKLRVRNASFVNVNSFPSGLFGGDTEISHSTIADDDATNRHVFGDGNIRVANSVIKYPHGQVCGAENDSTTQRVSLGGNVVSDNSCGFNGTSDRIVADARFLDFGAHGGVAKTLALNYDSPAIGNGVVANCEATDARGLARGQSACDSGAYEIGGGNGNLSATGMSGLYFNAANNGHYVSIQRLYGSVALVIWNTFDEQGIPAWLYGVGSVDGDKIHVSQVAQNIGGKLQPGGNVTPATATLWGSFDVSLSDCYNASLSYSSPLPQFGSGSTTLQRLAFLDGVNCAR